MINAKWKRFLAAAMSLSMILCLVFGVSAAGATGGATSTDTESSLTAEALEILGDTTWADYRAKYSTMPSYQGQPIIVGTDDLDQENLPAGAEILAELDGKTNVVLLPDEGTASWKVIVPENGLYAIDVSYYPIQAKATDIERTLRINGDVPFSEVRNIRFTKRWIDDLSAVNIIRDENGNITDLEYEKDAADNDRRPAKIEDPEWMTVSVNDPTGYYNDAFYFYLEAGENVISWEAQKEPIVMDTITLRKPEIVISYADYLAAQKAAGHEAAPAGSKIMLEAEFYSATSSSTIYGMNDRTSAITSPQHASYTWINDVGGKSGSYNWATIGQWIDWTFTIPEGKAGLYTINTRYLQNAIQGLFVSRRLYVDGTVPFEEANNLEFNYDSVWNVEALGDGKDEFQLYFSEGEHTIRLEVNLGNLGELISSIRNCVNRINAIYLKILQISGTDPDQYMDYRYYARIPDEISEMGELATELFALSERMQALGGGTSSSTATIENVARTLQTMASNSERQIAKNFKQLKSYIGNLGTWLNEMNKQALILDYIIIQPANEKLPKAEGNVFQNVWYEIKMFVYSFFRDNSSFKTTDTGEDVITVDAWTTVSREYAQIIRSIIDESLSRECPNISVNLKLVVAGTLLPATLSGVGPDIMMDVGSTDCINYAVRGAVVDMSGYEGFDELYGYFHESAWVPMTVALGSSDGDIAVYGIPEKQSFSVMFYRKDIFADLGLSVPTTWEEFNAIVPILVSKNYDVGMGHGAEITNMFIYQNGGQLYSNNGSTIAYDQDVVLDAFTSLCSFFTTYRFPLTFDASNRFRSGEMPVFVGDYISYYNQMTVFATELKGLWGFTSVPGTLRADGSLNNSTISSVNCIVMMKDAVTRGTDKASFEFIKWWMGATNQGQYANELIALLGPAGKYNTANMEAFNDMSWTASELREIKTQFSHLVGVPEMPGSYIIARYLEFAFLKVYNNGEEPSEALLFYVRTINKEFDRKREELKREFYIPDEE